MSWVEELSPAMAAELAKQAIQHQGASLVKLQCVAEMALDNLKTAELSVEYFEKSTGAIVQEVEFLRSTRRKLALEAAACLLLYWVALGHENRGENEGTGTGSGIQGGAGVP